MNKELLNLIKKLSDAFGPTGCEDEVKKRIIRYIGSCAKQDRFGNVVYFKKGTASKQTVMLTAYLDEVGFIVTKVEKEGYIRFATLGGLPTQYLSGRICEVGDENSRIKGVLAAKPIHLLSADERKKPTPADKIYVETGFTKEQLPENIRLGAFGTYFSQCEGFGEDCVKGKALSTRLGCAILCWLAKHKEQKNDTYFVFSPMYKVERARSALAAAEIKPDVDIALVGQNVAPREGTPVHTRQAVCGEGVVLSYVDDRTIFDRTATDAVAGLCKAKKIKYQYKRSAQGTADGGVNKAGSGVRCVWLAYPVKYINSANEIVSLSDADAMQKLLSALSDVDL